MNKNITIETIIIRHIYDEHPNDDLGEFTDDLEPGVIIREYDEFYENLPAPMERDIDGRFIGKGEPEIHKNGHEYIGFRPYAGGEVVGTEEYYKYGKEDWERMKGLLRGDWCYIGVLAEAEVRYPINGTTAHQTFSSHGLWGIESDSRDYIKEIEQEKLSELKGILEIFGVCTEKWEELTKNVEVETVFR